MRAPTLLQQLWHSAGGDDAALAAIRFDETAPTLPSTFHVGPLAAATIGAQALAAAALWQVRSGRFQDIMVDRRHALAMFRSERVLRIDGAPAPDPWSPIAGYYQAGDGRWIQLHTNFPHHRDGVLQMLGCDNTREAVASAIRGWQAEALETALDRRGLCASMIRTPEEWQAHPQAGALARQPLYELERIEDGSPPDGATGFLGRDGTRPLSGCRVLDLSRVIAAPVAARTLAQHGAEVLAIGAAHLPNIEALVIDTGRGKRSASLDLRDQEGCDALLGLVHGADVFLQAYRPGALDQRGLSPERLFALRPGLVHVSLCAYGYDGPWRLRRGYDSLVQSATGIAWREGRAQGGDAPGKLPCQALDHATGYIAAFATMMALRRRATEGGSWRVRVSLAQTGRWLESLGVAAGEEQATIEPDEAARYMERIPTAWGLVETIAPVERMSETPPRLDLPPVPPGSHPPAWMETGP